MVRKGKYSLQGLEILVSGSDEELMAKLWDLGTIGVVEHDDRVEAFFPDETDLSALMLEYRCRLIATTVDGAQGEGVVPESNQEPILAGEKFAIVPSGSPHATPAGRIRIAIDARNAFGSGSHESTQLVVRALEQWLKSGATLVDVGCGSGVICAVAQHLGNNILIACDPHEESVRLTRQQVPGVHAFVGSVDSIASGVADVVVANISARVVDLLHDDLLRIVKPEGVLMLSGFIAEHPPENFVPSSEMAMNEWRCWICRGAELATTKGRRKQASLQPFDAEWW